MSEEEVWVVVGEWAEDQIVHLRNELQRCWSRIKHGASGSLDTLGREDRAAMSSHRHHRVHGPIL